MGLILVVSEDVAEIETVKAALSVHGWWITVAADRETALQVAADQAPKLVVVDSELPGAFELLGSFGSCNGGPGVLTCVPQGFEDALEVKKAGGDEILTKPVSPISVLEAVQRCLAAPRPSPAERSEPSSHRLTTEEIFGDVLREIEEGDESIATSAAEAEKVETPPEPAHVDDELFVPEPVEPVVSLAGLLDEPAEPQPVSPQQSLSLPEPVSLPEPAPSESASSDASTGGEWQGEERRGVDRPWSGSSADLPVAAAEPAEPDEEAEPTELETDVATHETGVILEPASDEVLSISIEELEETAPLPDAPPKPERRIPRGALAIGSLAAALLVAVGVVFLLNSGSEPVDEPLPQPEVVEMEAEPVPEAPEVVTADTAPVPFEETAEVDSSAPTRPEEQSEELDDVNLEAIVEAELERREKELRRVFLEEEKRLLRELNNLEAGEEPAEATDENDAGDPTGVSR